MEKARTPGQYSRAALHSLATTRTNTMSITLYGIKNCDTMKRAFQWLAQHDVPYQFHDYKTQGIDADRLGRWCAELGWEALLNTRGTTWRKLTPAQQSGLDQQKAIALMMAQPSLIRRPVLESPQGLLVGFSPDDFSRAL